MATIIFLPSSTLLLLLLVAVIILFSSSSTVVAAAASSRSPSTHPMIAFSTIRSSASSLSTKRILDNTIIYNSRGIIYHPSRIVGRSSTKSFSVMSSASDDINSPSQTQQLATRLIRGNNNASRIKTCIAIAGGGSTASSAIASTSGASSLLLESIVTYDRRSFAEFVTNNQCCDVVFNSCDSQDNDETIDPTTDTGSDINPSNFSFCSTQAAVLLSQAALSRSIQLSPRFQDRALHCVGVGCASALVGNTESSDGGKISTAYIALSTLRKGTTVWKVKLENSKAIKSTDKRSRGEEEMVISNLVLASMIQYREELEKDDYDSMIQQILDKDGDELTVRSYKVNGSDGRISAQDCSPASGASRIIQGDANIVSILPVLQTTNDDCSPQYHMETALADNQNPFPNDVIIVPGSYNPPHHGHIGLANAAVKALQQIRRSEEKECNESSLSYSMLRSRYSSLESFSTTSSTSSLALKSIWNKVDRYTYPTVLFEMSVTNADKPPLDPSEVERRVGFFPTLSDMPNDWGVILTNAPLFSQKCLLEEVLNCSPFSDRRMTFVLGTDTFVRIINPKYYNNSVEKMIDALVEMKEKGVHFIVGGRLEQTASGSKKFINGEEEVKSLPMHVQEMFTLLTEEEFRLDVSSTEIRKQMEER
eukprot:scaffold12532_cov156-Skeletonema_menzelii.AAC.2